MKAILIMCLSVVILGFVDDSLNRKIEVKDTLYYLLEGKLLGEKESLEVNEIQPIYKPNPNYPEQAAANKVSGSVSFTFNVNEKGEVEDLTIIESIPKGVFDEVATKAIKRWRFKPAILEGRILKTINAKYTLVFEIQ